jgi:hypothetical protein
VAPGYLERVREAAAALGLGGGTDSEAALVALHDAAAFDLDPPVLSPSPAARYAKLAVKRLGAWYVRYLGEQVEVFAAAAAALGDALVRQAERLEERTASLHAQLDDLAAEHRELAARVDRLEGPAPGRAEPTAAGRPHPRTP